MVGNILQELQGSKQRLTHQVFKGVVVDNDDPLKRQRLRVRIRDMHRGLQDADIPWARKASSGFGTGGGTGEVNIPPVGSTVNIRFLDNSMYYPEWVGGSDDDAAALGASFPDYPHSRGWRDHAGNSWVVNTKGGSVTATFTHVSGTSIHIDNDGRARVVVKTFEVHAEEDIDLRAGGDIKLQAGGKVISRGSQIQQNDAGAEAPDARTAGTRPVIPQTTNATEF